MEVVNIYRFIFLFRKKLQTIKTPARASWSSSPPPGKQGATRATGSGGSGSGITGAKGATGATGPLEVLLVPPEHMV